MKSYLSNIIKSAGHGYKTENVYRIFTDNRLLVFIGIAMNYVVVHEYEIYK